jgi:hypothetical protein
MLTRKDDEYRLVRYYRLHHPIRCDMAGGSLALTSWFEKRVDAWEGAVTTKLGNPGHPDAHPLSRAQPASLCIWIHILRFIISQLVIPGYH